MTLSASDSRERLIADSQFGGGATTWAPATWFMGISTSIPNDDGTNFTEPVGGAYARVSVTNNATNFPAATTTSGVTLKLNGTAVNFPTPSLLWGTISYYGWFTASSGGTPEYTFKLQDPITVNSGNTPVQFAIGQLSMQWD